MTLSFGWNERTVNAVFCVCGCLRRVGEIERDSEKVGERLRKGRRESVRYKEIERNKPPSVSV